MHTSQQCYIWIDLVKATFGLYAAILDLMKVFDYSIVTDSNLSFLCNFCFRRLLRYSYHCCCYCCYFFCCLLWKFQKVLLYVNIDTFPSLSFLLQRWACVRMLFLKGRRKEEEHKLLDICVCVSFVSLTNNTVLEIPF